VPDQPDPRVEIVWTTAQSQLEAQKATVDELRARVGILISGAAIATGFLAGQALNTKHGIPAGAWLGIVATSLFLVLCGIILWPRKLAGQFVDTTTVLQDIDNRPDEPVDDFQRDMATFAMDKFKVNEGRLKQLYWVFSAALVLLGADFAGWVWALIEQ
jgi:hypothetical protein